MIKVVQKYKYVFLIFFISVILFWQFFLKGLIPLPADTMIGDFHPWRDLYSKNYPNGIPVNNPLITDPVSQQFVWKKLVVDSYKNGKLPIENPYSFSGYPLLANFQSGAFYPLNILFFIFSFNTAWSLYIFLQFFLGGLFMYLFLYNMLRHCEERSDVAIFPFVAFLGSSVWILSGFWISWAEWGNVLHTALWLPLILLAVNKIIFYRSDNSIVVTTTSSLLSSPPRKLLRGKLQRRSRLWYLIYLFALLSSFFAGHLQTFFYIYIFSVFYFLFLLRTTNYVLRTLLIFFILNSIFLILSLPQWYPTLQFILASGRSTDISNVLTREDWFIPFKHLMQLFIPDYFGSPAKGNYFGVWNYGEYLSYVGIIPIFLAIIGIIKSAISKKNIFWLVSLLIVIIFATKNSISIIPYRLAIPFFSTAQPSRLIFLLDFLLVVFFAKEIINYYDNSNYRSNLFSKLVFLISLCLLMSLSFYLNKDHFSIIFRNSIQPIAVFVVFSLIFLILPITQISLRSKFFFSVLFLLIFFDQSRVFWKYNTFSKEEYIFPETKITKFLENDLKNGFFRISSLDARIMPPNFNAYYKIPSIDGYDPLYYENYARIISKGESTNFNRIIQLSSPNSKIYDELKVKYVLTFNNLSEKEFELVLTEGETKLFRYLNFK